MGLEKEVICLFVIWSPLFVLLFFLKSRRHPVLTLFVYFLPWLLMLIPKEERGLCGSNHLRHWSICLLECSPLLRQLQWLGLVSLLTLPISQISLPTNLAKKRISPCSCLLLTTDCYITLSYVNMWPHLYRTGEHSNPSSTPWLHECLCTQPVTHLMLRQGKRQPQRWPRNSWMSANFGPY